MYPVFAEAPFASTGEREKNQLINQPINEGCYSCHVQRYTSQAVHVPKTAWLFEVICELLREELQEQTDLWIAYRGDSRIKWSVDCLQRRFKNRLICGLLTEEIQDRETRKWLTFKRTEKIKVMCRLTTRTHLHTDMHTHTQTHINTEVLSPQTQGHSTSKIFFFSSPSPPPLKLLLVTSPGHEWWW